MSERVSALQLLRDELVEAEERVQLLRQAVQFLKMAQRIDLNRPQGERPLGFQLPLERASTKDAVVKVLEDDPGRDWRLGPLVVEMQRQGWAVESEDPEAVVRTALNRLRSENAVERRGYGSYGAKALPLASAITARTPEWEET